jgi:trigger factor
MNITQENIDELNAVLKVKVVADDYLPKVEGALKEYQRKANVPGFRPGKVPAGMIKKMYGKSILVDEINKLLSDSLYKYINENKIEVLGNPLPKADSTHIDWDNQKEFEFMYEMGLAPKFSVDLSPKDKFVYQTVRVDDDLVNKYVSDIAKRYGKVEASAVSSEGDLLNGDFVELDANGEILPGGIFKTSSIFMDRLKDDAKKAFTGLKVEDKIVVESQNLCNTATDLAAMLGITKEEAEALNVKLQFTVKSISRLAAAEINQELFDKIYGPGVVNSEEEFRMKIREELASMFVNDSERKFYNDVVEHLMGKINFNLPADFLKRWIVAVNEKPVTPEQVETEFEGYAKGLKWQLIENKIISDNQITVSNEEVIEHTKELILQQFGRMNPSPMNDEELNDTAKRVLANQEEAKKLYEKLYGQKVMTLFKTKFTLENKEVAYDEFFKKG